MAKTERLDEQESRALLSRPAAKAAAEDSQKGEELETQWHQEEALRSAKALPPHLDLDGCRPKARGW